MRKLNSKSNQFRGKKKMEGNLCVFLFCWASQTIFSPQAGVQVKSKQNEKLIFNVAFQALRQDNGGQFSFFKLACLLLEGCHSAPHCCRLDRRQKQIQVWVSSTRGHSISTIHLQSLHFLVLSWWASELEFTGKRVGQGVCSPFLLFFSLKIL